MWPWAPAAVRAEAVPALTDGAFLLATLNEALTRTALLVQPLHLPTGVRLTAKPSAASLTAHVENMQHDKSRNNMQAAPLSNNKHPSTVEESCRDVPLQ